MEKGNNGVLVFCISTLSLRRSDLDQNKTAVELFLRFHWIVFTFSLNCFYVFVDVQNFFIYLLEDQFQNFGSPFFQDPIPTVPVKGTPVKSGLHSYTLEDLAYARSGDKGTEQVKRIKFENLFAHNLRLKLSIQKTI